MNKKIYSFDISDEPQPRKRYRYGELQKIVYKDGSSYPDRKSIKLAGKPRVEDEYENLDKIIIEIHYQKKSDEPYPDFMYLRWAFICGNNNAKEFLNNWEIQYRILPIEFTNDQEHNYETIFFNQVANLINLEKSNLYLDKDGFVKTKNLEYFSPVESTIVLNGNATNVKGIYQLRECATMICDEETKEKLESSGLTGFRLEELQVSE